LELLQEIPELYQPYYAGWTREEMVYDSAFCIHHPNGDLEKISKSNTLNSVSKYGSLNNFWVTNWQSLGFKTGATQIGSSGSAIFNTNKQIIGTLSTGNSSCDFPLNLDYFGKFSYHWASNGKKADEQLKPWLDPDNLGIISLQGSYKNSNSIEYIAENEIDIKLFPNPAMNYINITTNLISEKEMNIKILSISGTVVFHEIFRINESVKINISNLPKGIYFLKINTNFKTGSKQFIKL